MATRKAPTGAKHDRCIGHIEHPYPAKGMLCFGEVIGRDGIVEFADHLAKTRAEHRAAFLAEPEPAPSWFVNPDANPRDRELVTVGDYLGHPVVPRVCTGNGNDGGCHAFSIHAHGGFATVPQIRGRQDDGLAELVARFRAMRGLPAEAPAVVAPARKAPRVKAAPESPVCVTCGIPLGAVASHPNTGQCHPCWTAEHIPAPAETPAPVLEPVAIVETAPEPAAETPVELCPAAADGYLTCTRPAGHGGKHDGPAPMLPGQRCTFYHQGGGTSINDVPRCTLIDGHDGSHVWPVNVEPAPDTYAAAVEVAETRPDPCEECGHPAHGATCATCDDAAQVGTYAPCASVAPVQAPAEPIAAPAPVLSAPARPTCERCGQVFRLKGSGAEWHRVNRPDCARVAAAV